MRTGNIFLLWLENKESYRFHSISNELGFNSHDEVVYFGF